VSTCRKSTARIPAACAWRSCRHVGPCGAAPGRCPRHAGSPTPWTARPSPRAWLVRRGSGGVPTADSLSPGERQGGRCPGPSAGGRAWAVARVVLARGQPAMPGQQRRGRDGEDFGPAPAREQSYQRGEPHPVCWLVPGPVGVPTQDRVSVPQHQQFSVLRHVPAGQQHSQAKHPANQQVDDLEQHAASQPSRSPGCWRRHRSAAQSIIRAAQVRRQAIR
jgi:hypothetical protein